MKIVKFWSFTEHLFDSLIVLTDRAIIVSNPQKEEHPRIVEQLDKGNLKVVEDPKTIPWDTIKKVSTNRKGTSIEIDYNENDSADISFNEITSRDDVFSSLKTRLGDTATLSTKDHSALTASFTPLIALIVCGAITVAGYLGAQEIAAGNTAQVRGGRKLIQATLVWLMGVLGPTGVIVLGSLVCLCIIIWLAIRIKNPPIIDTLEIRK